MKRIILDTNFLIIPGELNVDIFTEIQRIANFPYRIYTFDRVINELNKLAREGSGKLKQAAKLGLQLIAAKQVEVIKSKNNLNADELILQSTNPETDIVATQDRELKRKLKERGVHLLVLRKKKYLNLI